MEIDRDCMRLGACNLSSIDTDVTLGIMVWGLIESAFRSTLVVIQRTLIAPCYASSILCLLHVLLLLRQHLITVFQKDNTRAYNMCACGLPALW